MKQADYLKMGVAMALGATALATRSKSRSVSAVSGFAGAVLLGFTAVEVARASGRRRIAAARTEVARTITIQRSADDLYAFWRDLGNLPRVFTHLESVTALDEVRSRWKSKGPAGTTAEWIAEIIEDVPGASMAWRSMPGSDIEHEGRVQFLPAPGDRGTEVHVRLGWAPPAGSVGVAIAKLLHAEPSQQIGSDLRRLKQILETGGVTRSDASIHRGMHAARPSDDVARIDWRVQ